MTNVDLRANFAARRGGNRLAEADMCPQMETDKRPLWHAQRPPNPLLETSIVLPRRGALRKLVRRLRMNRAQRTWDIAAAPDRAVLRDEIFPEVSRRAGDILFVGVRAYTAGYPALLERHGGRCWTLDIASAAAPFGAPGRHVTGCIMDLKALLAKVHFTTIVLTGVLGFGVNRFSDQRRAIAACAEALIPTGTLVLGWNDRRVHASLLEEAASRWYDLRAFGSLPARIWIHEHDHNFAFLERRR